MSWETSTVVMPCFFNSPSMAPNFTLKPPSIPLVGSSSKRISGFVRRTFPSASRCCCPPLRSSGFCSLNSVSSIFSSISSTALGSLPQQTASSSSAVISVKILSGFCTRYRTVPFVFIFPLRGFKIPQISFISVVFPAPFPPNNP